MSKLSSIIIHGAALGVASAQIVSLPILMAAKADIRIIAAMTAQGIIAGLVAIAAAVSANAQQPASSTTDEKSGND